MIEKLCERLDALARAAAAIRGLARDRKAAAQLDGLAVARVLLAVDGAVRKLNRLAEDLEPDLFDGEESA